MQTDNSTTEDKSVDASGGVAAVERAFAILGAFDEVSPALSLAELARRTELYKSTILRLMVSLERTGYVERSSDGLYRIGPTACRVGALFKRDLRLEERLLPLMRALGATTRESVSFYVPRAAGQHMERMCLLRVDAPRSVRDNLRVGEILPLGNGSGGRVIRAFSDQHMLEDEGIRSEGVYASWGERDPEIGGIAAPVFGPDKRIVGALTLSAPTSRRDRSWLESMKAVVRDTAREASHLLGGQ